MSAATDERGKQNSAERHCSWSQDVELLFSLMELPRVEKPWLFDRTS